MCSQDDSERISSRSIDKKYLSTSYVDSKQSQEPYTFEQYALIHFKTSSSGNVFRRSFSGHIQQHQRRSGHNNGNNMWYFSSQLIKRPLLKETCILPEMLQHKACKCFKLILKYMGDYTTKKQPYSITTKLFEIPLTLKSLRNEVYCQIIKQITHNKTYSSRERGWELLWLASGLFPSSDPFLQDELSCFVQANDRNMPQMAPDIYQRLSWMAQDGCGSRQYPPLMIEVNAIHLHQLQLFQTFYLPDESTQMVRITSITRSCDVVNEIGKMIGLQSSEGFGLVISAGDKVVTIDEESYLFDIIYHYTPDPAAQSIDNCFQFIFLKTHWINVNIGDDNKADISFYYHQELAKYSCGYHKLTFDEAALLGSYVYRATFGPEPFHLDPINDIIMDLIPQTIYAQNVSKDWPTSILQRFGQHSITTADEAKCNFLRYLSRWPTFASHIIKVKINLVESLVAINQYNMLIISSADQEISHTIPLSSIVSWSYSLRNKHFLLLAQEQFHFQTQYSYEMNQLLLYYISYATANKDSIRKKHRISIICDSLM